MTQLLFSSKWLSARSLSSGKHCRTPLSSPLSLSAICFDSCFEILPEKKERKADNYVATPMPGTLISLNVNEGDTVFEGQEIAVVEAMKMQNQLLAPRAGKIKKIYVKVWCLPLVLLLVGCA